MSKNFKIGAGIALDGEKEFKQAVSGINQDIKVLASEMGKVTAEFGDNAKSVEALTAKQDVLNRQLLNQTDKVDVLKKALQDSADKYGEADKRTKDWQISLNKAEAELSKTKNEIDKTTKEIDDFGDESKQSGEEIEKAGKKAKDSGDDAKKGGDGWDKLGHGLSKVGGMAADAAKALAAASIAGAAAIGAITVKAGEAADEINTLSKVTGMSTSDIQKFKFAADRIDVSLETLTKSMAKNIKSMKGVQDGTKLSIEAYKKLGVEVLNADGSLRDGQEVYGEVIDALGKMENETERDAIAMQILGKSAQDLNPLILGGADALKQMGEEAEAAGLILDQYQLDKLNAVSDAFDTLKATMGGVGMQFASEFAGPISEGINIVTGYVNGLLSAYKAGGMDALAEKTGEVLGDVINSFAENLPDILDATVSIINGILDSIIENIPEMTQTGVEFFASLITNAWEIIAKIVSALPDVVRGIAGALTANDGEMIRTIITAGVDLFVALIQNAGEIITIIADSLPEIIDGIVDGLFEDGNLGKIVNAGIDLFVSLVTKVPDIILGIVEQVPEIIDGIVDAITSPEMLNKIADAGVKLFSNLFTDFADDIDAFLKDPWDGTPVDWETKDILGGAGRVGRMTNGSGFSRGARASGGPVYGGSPYIVGEEGPELFVPKTSGSIMPNGNTNALIDTLLAGIGGGNLTVQVVVNDEVISQSMLPAFRRITAANPEAVSDF